MAKKNNKYEEAVGNLDAKVTMLQTITLGVMIALAVGFVALFISAVAIFHDAYTNKAVTYLELTREVRDINQKLDVLAPELKNETKKENI